MNRKILWQVCDSLRQSPISLDQQIVMGTQLIAWTLLSSDGRIDSSLSIDTLVNSPTDDIPADLAGLEALSEPVGQAMSGLFRAMSTAGMAATRSAVALCRKLQSEGMLEKFSPLEVIPELLADTRTGVTVCPPEFAKLMTLLTQAEQTESAYCAWDDIAQLTGRLLPDVKLVFLETQVFSPLPALMSLFIGGELVTRFGDPVRDPGAVEKGKLKLFDIAVGIPPFGLRIDPKVASNDLFNRFSIPKATWSVLTVQHLLARATRRVVVAVPNSLLFGSGSDRALREELVRAGNVQSVISLPSGMLPGMNIAIAILVLSPEGNLPAVRFVNADSPRFCNYATKSKVILKDSKALAALALGSTPDDNVADVPIADVLANDAQLQVARYVLLPQQRSLRDVLARMPKVPLSDLVETVRPPITSGADQGGAVEIREVAAADLPSHGFIRTTGRSVFLDPEQMNKGRNQFLRPGDIVLVTKGSIGKVGIVPVDAPPPGPGGWVPVQSATVLRVLPGSAIEPKALAMLLRSALGQQLMSTIAASGSVIPFISLRELTRLEVPLPPLVDMVRAASILDTENEFQRQIDELRDAQIAVSNDLWRLE